MVRNDEISEIDVGVVIALREEFRDFHTALAANIEFADGDAAGTSWYRFSHPAAGNQASYRGIVTFVGEMGPTESAVITERLILRHNPATVVMLGIAGAIHEDVLLGDVIVATQIDGYLEGAKVRPEEAPRDGFEFQLGGTVHQASYGLLERIRNLEFRHAAAFLRWKEDCGAELSRLLEDGPRNDLLSVGALRTQPALLDVHVASGPAVVSSSSFSTWLRERRDRNCKVVEMESHGVMTAACRRSDPTRTLVLRGISDLGDERKKRFDHVDDGGLRRLAMRNATRLLWTLLDVGILPRAAPRLHEATPESGVKSKGRQGALSRPEQENQIAEGAELDRRIAEEQAREQHQVVESLRREGEARLRAQRNRIPYRRDPLFRGRETEIETVIRALRSRHSLQLQSHIVGMGGVGKTALAVEVAFRVIDAGHFRDGVLWYRMRDESEVDAAIECARTLGFINDLRDVSEPTRKIRVFESMLRKLDLLVVLDNADLPIGVMRPIFDLFRGTPLLVTSRNELQLPDAAPMRLGGLRAETAREFVKDVLSGLAAPRLEAWRRFATDEDVEDLCATFGQLPLALKLASFFILRHRIRIEEYLAEWRTRRDKLSLLVAEQLMEREERLRDIRACFALSFDQLGLREQRLFARMSLWQAREFAVDDFIANLDESVFPDVKEHDWRVVTSASSIGGEGRWCLTGGDDGRVLLWDLHASGRPKPRLTVLQSDVPVTDILMSSDRSRIGIQLEDGRLAVISVDPVAKKASRATWRLFPSRQRFGFHENEPVWHGRNETEHFAMGVFNEKFYKPGETTWPTNDVDQIESLAGLIDHTFRPKPAPHSFLVDFVEASNGRRFGTIPIASIEARVIREAIAEFISVSLVDEVPEREGRRLRLHPLVSEFAGSHLESDVESDGRRALFEYYLTRFDNDQTVADRDLENLEAAWKWSLSLLTSTKKIEGLNDSALERRLRLFHARGRWHLVRLGRTTILQAAERTFNRQAIAVAKISLAWILRKLDDRSTAASLESEGIEALWDCHREAPLCEAPDSSLAWALSWRKDRFGVAALLTLEKNAKYLRPFESLDSARAWMFLRIGEEIPAVRSLQGHLLESEVDYNRALLLVGIASRETPEKRVELLQELVRDGMRERNEAILAVALSELVDALTVLGDFEQARRNLADYRAVAELVDLVTLRREAKELEAWIELRESDVTKALAVLAEVPESAERLSEPLPVLWFSRVYFALCATDVSAARDLLGVARKMWTELGLSRRFWYHAFAAWLGTLVGEFEIAGRSWELAKELAASDTVGSDIPRRFPELFAAMRAIGSTGRATDKLSESGRTGESQYALLQEATLLQHHKSQKNRVLVEPFYLRDHPVTVAELRAFCSNRSTPLPYYYRIVRPEAAESEYARFVPFRMAHEIVASLDHELAGASTWRGMPSDLRSHAENIPAPVEWRQKLGELREQDVNYQKLMGNCFVDIDESRKSLVEQVLWAQELSATDKYRAVKKLQVTGLEGFGPRARALLERLRPLEPDTARLSAGVIARLRADLRSVAFLSGLVQVDRLATWLRIDWLLGTRRDSDIGGLGAIGTYCPPRLRAHGARFLLVPDGFAWADVEVWPGKMFDLSRYKTAAPTWP